MWEAISNILSGSNALMTLLFVLAILAIFIVCARTGIVSIRTNNVTLGKQSAEKERTVMRHQIEYARTACSIFEQQVPRNENHNLYRIKYIIECIYDEMLNWIIFNHIEDNPIYITNKQNIVWGIVIRQTDEDDALRKTDKFKEAVFKQVETDVRELTKIREYYAAKKL